MVCPNRQEPIIMHLHNSIMDLNNTFMETHKSIIDLDNWFMCLDNSIYGASLLGLKFFCGIVIDSEHVNVVWDSSLRQ